MYCLSFSFLDPKLFVSEINWLEFFDNNLTTEKHSKLDESQKRTIQGEFFKKLIESRSFD